MYSLPQHFPQSPCRAGDNHGLFPIWHKERARDLANIPSIRIYSLAALGCFARVWGARPQITYSEYFDDCKAGEYKDGILCQDVQALTFEDAYFDLVISEDVFEHVKDYRQGFREVYRVLKPGGYHIFTVPLGFSQPTLDRVVYQDGKEKHLLPPEYHGDPIRGTGLAVSTFGYDLFEELHKTGFEVSLRIFRYAESRKYGIFDNFILVTRKPPEFV